MELSDIFFVTSIILLWGLWGFFSKLGVQKIGVQVIFYTYTIAFLLMTAYLVLTHQFIPLKLNILGISFAIIAGVSITVGSILFYLFLSSRSAGYLVTITALYPLVTILLSILLLKESITPVKILGFAFGITALILLNL